MNAEPERSTMTKAERDDLARLVRRRAKLAQGDADRLAAEMLAEFELQVATDYHVDDDVVWAEAHAAAEQAVAEANARISERCRELGIRERFQPHISVGWWSRGEHAAKERVAELRRVAKSRLDANAKAAKVEIERQSLDVQTQLVAGGLESEEASVPGVDADGRAIDSRPDGARDRGRRSQHTKRAAQEGLEIKQLM